MERDSKHNYYLDIAQTVASRGTCLRRSFGAIIVQNDSILATGYNTAMLFYSDFYYPDADGVKRKSILCVPITVED